MVLLSKFGILITMVRWLSDLIIEFGAVLALPETGVGGYYNTAIDLVANGLGALLAATVIVHARLGVNGLIPPGDDAA